MMHGQTKEQVVKRLKRARGHLTRVIKMVEKGDYCPDILIQSSAVQGALKKSDEIILDSHLHTCVVPKLGGKTDEKALSELLEVFKRR
jgi:DNA-binding FrmR family transcriptional regulator